MEYVIPTQLASMNPRQVMKTTYMAQSVSIHGVCSNCAHCGLSLTDAMSIETGLGPICRKKSNYNGGPDEEGGDDTIALALLSQYPEVLLFLVSNCGKDKSALMKAMVRIASLNRNTQMHRDLTNSIEALGWKRLAAHLRKPFAGIVIAKLGECYSLKILKKYYNYEFWGIMRQFVDYRFNRADRCAVFAMEEKAKVWHALKLCYPNFIMKTPDGYASVPGPSMISEIIA